MKKRILIAAVVAGLVISSLAYAFDGRPMRGRGDWGDGPRHQEILNQLPAEKATLVRDTFRDARQRTTDIRDQLASLRNEVKDILSAPQFNEALYREKTAQMQALRAGMHDIMTGAVAALAVQLTQEERKVLAELVPPGPGGHGRGPRR